MRLSRLIVRYSFSRYNRHRSSTLKIAISFAFSLSALMIVLSLMSSLQDSRFDSIRAVRSFDITIKDGDLDEIKGLYSDYSVFDYYEGYAMLNGRAFTVRYIDESYDGGINLLYGDNSTLMAGYSFYITEGRDVTFSKIGMEGNRRSIITEEIGISGVFYSELSEFDSSTLFMPKERASSLDNHFIAIKGTDDASALVKAGITGFETWREKESTLYSAFTLENFMMSSVLLVLLLIVYVEIRQEARVFIKNKSLERLELVISGLEKWRANSIFILSFLLTLFLGSILALIISYSGISIFRVLLRTYLHYYRPLNLNLSLFFEINIVFYLISALTVLSYLKKTDKKSIREALYE